MSQITGLAGVLAALESLKAAKGKRVERNLKRAGLQLLAWSLELVPVETGTLKATGKVRSDGSGFATVVTVSYGTEYGIYVHENLDAAHGAAYNAKHALAIASGADFARGPNQQAKFLTDPLTKRKAELLSIITEDL